MTEWVRFGRGQGGFAGYAERVGSRVRGKQNLVELGSVKQKQGGTRQLRANARFKNNDINECRCNANDAMR